jgi:NIMA (never in mitosis gene a)-related kinase 1/4/5
MVMHPNIIKLIDTYTTKRGKLVMILEFAENKDLMEEIKLRKSQDCRLFTEAQIIDYFAQICLGVKYLHDRNLLHRDLKADNVFLSKNNFVKLGDLGCARVMESSLSRASTICGTP